MPGFDDARRSYRSAAAEASALRTDLIRARETLKALAREEESLRRIAGDESADARLAEVARLKRKAQRYATHALGEIDRSRLAQAVAFDEFGIFTDPIQGVENWPDDVPIALFPLRLETRYRTTPAGEAAPRRLLQVRAYPDDVLVDTFQPEISQAELDNIRRYWTDRWAGGDVAGHRAAWAALARAHGAGRAKWLVGRFAPLNPADEPVRNPGEHILVILGSAPADQDERAAVATYWDRVWLSGGADREAALRDLSIAVGEDSARFIAANAVPANLPDSWPRPDASIAVLISYLLLPDPASLPISQEDWTRGAHAWLLPQRLVLLGYQDGVEVLRQTGEPIPHNLQIGPDPASGDDQQITADGADLSIPEGMRWTVDFDEAVAKGMGFVVDLTHLGLDSKFDRLFVLGLRLASDATDGAAECEALIRGHQASRKGFSLLPQGRPTNNTDQASAGYSWWENVDEAFDHFFLSDPDDDPKDWEKRKDGAWLAGLLGLDHGVLRDSPHYFGTDQAEARAMNSALWPATLGYYMEQMMGPVFSETDVLATREFFRRFVIGRGTLPLVRIGRQPYGVMPATAWSRMSWWTGPAYARAARAAGLPTADYLERIDTLIGKGAAAWRTMAEDVSKVGGSGGDAQKILLDIIGLHPASAEFYQRYSQSFTQYYNQLGFESDLVSAPMTSAAQKYVQAGLLTLSGLGWTVAPGGELPDLLEKIFLKKPNLLKGHLVEPELSETARLSVARGDGLNYLAWLAEAARTSHDMLRRQEGFPDGPPSALLYLMLHHAIDLGFVDSGLRLERDTFQLTDAAYFEARKEPKFIGIAEKSGRGSRWRPLYSPAPAVTGDPDQRLGDFIPAVAEPRGHFLHRQTSALDILKTASTASLERAFTEHLDCLSYRLDSWRLAVQAVQLSYMRRETPQGFSRGGLHIGAYGWVENLEPASDGLTSVEFDSDLAEFFDDPAAPRLMRDSGNFGHIHAPSLDHAVTAAILRNGHLANRTPSRPDLLAVDLSSERVRLAQKMIEGMRTGQSLGALLGYMIERRLHDEPDLFLDRLIYALRSQFPLVGNRNMITRIPALTDIRQVEARNVVDGAAFAEHIEKVKIDTYPYGLTGLPPLSVFTGPGLPTAAAIGALIDSHVAMMRSVGDAVADLAVAEGVYQVVRGNFDRAAGSLDAFSKGTHPPETEVSATPRSGHTLTHRLALHLRGGLLPGAAGLTTPRAQGEPALAQWLARQMPDPATIFARIAWQDVAGDVRDATPNMAELGLAAIDLFYMIDSGGANEMAGFDGLLIDFAERNGEPAPPHGTGFSLEYHPAGMTGLTLFELAPLVRALRGFVLGARPLRPSDLSLQNEASAGGEAIPVLRADKATAVRDQLQAVMEPIDDFLATLAPILGETADPDVARDSARDGVDQWMVDFAGLVRAVAPFGLQATSLTRAVEGRRRPFQMMLNALDELIARWTDKASQYAQVKAELAALPPGAAEEDRVALLIRAGRIVSTSVIAPLPATIAQLENEVDGLKGAFDASLAALTAIRGNAAETGELLRTISASLPALEAFDLTPFDVLPFRDAVLALVKDLAAQAEALREDVARRDAAAGAALAAAAAATGEKAQAAIVDAIQAMLGKAFILLPEFSLGAARLAEWAKSWADRDFLLDHFKTGVEATPFPVEDWLHGLGRVRSCPRQLEMAALLGPTLGAEETPALTALQFPYRANDVWLGVRFPPAFRNGDAFKLDGDKLLYTAHFATGAAIDAADPARTYCGLMLDEWIELIPGTKETTGLSFHYDRPSNEAPQTILLVTPPQHRGSWAWQDIVDSLHETLDFARIRAVEPSHIDQSTLAPFLPATLSAVTMLPITSMLNFAYNSDLQAILVAEVPADE